MPHRREVSWAHVARGSNCRADFWRILDQLDSQRTLAAVARLLVGLERGRSFFTAIHGIRRVQVPAHVRGSDHSLGSNHVRRSSQAKASDR